MKSGWLNYALGFSICGFATYYAVLHMGPNAVVVVALWGALLAKPVLEGMLFVFRYFNNAPLTPFQGRYYAFNHHQIRVFEVNQALWIVDEDILPIIAMSVSDAAKRCANPDDYRYLERQKVWVYAQTHLMTLVQNSRHPTASHLARWLQHTVYKPYRTKMRYAA